MEFIFEKTLTFSTQTPRSSCAITVSRETCCWLLSQQPEVTGLHQDVVLRRRMSWVLVPVQRHVKIVMFTVVSKSGLKNGRKFLPNASILYCFNTVLYLKLLQATWAALSSQCSVVADTLLPQLLTLTLIAFWKSSLHCWLTRPVNV
jgi:hypothetical protein